MPYLPKNERAHEIVFRINKARTRDYTRESINNCMHVYVTYYVTISVNNYEQCNNISNKYIISFIF